MYIVIANGSDIYLRSTDGENWTKSSFPTDGNWSSICYGYDRFVLIENNSDLYLYRTDGENWTQSSLLSSSA